MARAVFDGVVIAESNDITVTGGISYFPASSVTDGSLLESPTTTRCSWKGKASYFHVDNGEDTALDAAFAYHRPWLPARRLVGGRVGFWREVSIEK